ncbi:hypothetical protein FRC14_006259 [Serendipita sp. 396]|nr:hypothetical protein FRC14_006259 [Serendipita sp. 396]KAG8789623.1 hypothetical protein FRC15_006355 [Serendipita sp. 397]KAG8804417.1 hypothetical protein FRC16_008939 [Serendipita sp. 398]KAG8827732.1 hypothetical protein FRC19_000741 [Serendipita sp. 401]KAG8878098.1 hypothetical protein FRC20_009383 [Serendipita sp. 405]
MPASSGLFPALNLYPLNDSFVPKHIVLAGGQRVKVGRQTSAKTIPGDRNGYFDSKVLSRQHAEVWEENGKIWIKDVKSSNGTFINGTRLSQEGVESAPFELNTGDQVEFGIDIVGEDNQTIIHHKVAARVQCILTQEDLNEAQQAAYAQQAQHQGLGHPQQNHLPQGHPGQRRPSLHGAPNHQGSLGALAPVGRVPNKSGLSFDLILSRLQSEVQRSRETSAELHSLTAAMSEIHDSLGGVSAQAVPAYPHVLPPVRHDADPTALPPPSQDAAVITTIQEQLHHTQSILSNHVEKIQNLGLEGIVGEHDGIKREIGVLRDLIDQQKHEIVLNSNVQRSRPVDEDDDDARSVSTVVPGEQFVDEELDDENLEERRQRSRELGRPRTPEPSMGLDDSDGEDQAGVRVRRATIRRNWDAGTSRSENDTGPPVPVATQECVDRLASRLEQLAAQFESAMEHSRELQVKQSLAQEQIASLQAKVEELEANKESPLGPEADREDATSEAAPSVVASLLDLTRNLEGRWDRQQEEWESERERLKATKEEWEKRVRRVEEDLVGVREIAAAASTSAIHANTVAALATKEIAALRAEFHEDDELVGADASEFAPPSPRSISSDILRHRKKSTRQKSRSRSRSPTRNIPNGHPVNEEDTIQPYSPTSINSGPYANGQAIESNGYNSDGRRLPSSMKGLDPPSRSDSMSSPSDHLTIPSQRSDMPLSVIPAAATLFVAIAGIAAWTAATHMHT